MNLEQLWLRFLNDGIQGLTTDELEELLYLQRARILKLEREANTAVRLSGVTANEINISGVSVTR